MTRALTKVDRLKSIINQPTVQEQFKNAMGKHSDLFIASLIDVFNSGLQNCEPGGVIQEALKAAVLKLPISKSLGFAYLVPYGGQAQFQIGYKGMIQLAMRTGQVKRINAGVVYEGEWKSTDKIRGIFDFSGEKTSDKVVGYFSYMELINGFEKTVYWTTEEVIKHAKAKSKSYGNRKSAWSTDFDAMATKTTLRALFSKYAPMSIDFIAGMTYDAEDADIDQAKNIDLEVDEKPKPPAPNFKAPETKTKAKPKAKKEDKKAETKAEVWSVHTRFLDDLLKEPLHENDWKAFYEHPEIKITKADVQSAIAENNALKCEEITDLFNQKIIG